MVRRRRQESEDRESKAVWDGGSEAFERGVACLKPLSSKLGFKSGADRKPPRGI